MSSEVYENGFMESDVLFVFPSQALRGVLGKEAPINLPGDKSLSHRAAILASLADGESTVDNFLDAGVAQVLLRGLRQIGIHYQLEGTRLIVQGVGLNPPSKAVNDRIIDCGNSATTMRLLAGALAAWGIGGTLDGSEGLRKRPMTRIIEPLRRMGVEIDDIQGHAPLRIFPRNTPLKPLDYQLPVASAQVKSCLLLAGLAYPGVTRLSEPSLSRDHTERMLQIMGVTVRSAQGSDHQHLVEMQPPSGKKLFPLRIHLPGDFSSAAFLIVAALIIPGSTLVLEDVGLNFTRTGLLEVLIEMGAQIQIEDMRLEAGEPVGRLVVHASKLRGVSVEGEIVARMIDEFPIFSVAAAYASGISVVRQAKELRHKESDRIHSLCHELKKLGAHIREFEDGFVIEGGKRLTGGTVTSHQDHRLAMALTVAGLAAQDVVRVEQAGVIRESFPRFVETLRVLGAEVLE